MAAALFCAPPAVAPHLCCTPVQMEMDSIRQKQAKLRKQRDARKKKGTKASSRSTAGGASKSTKKLTEPKEFSFQSEQRAKSHSRDPSYVRHMAVDVATHASGAI